ncbi:HdeD family acid-resistance protein [Streptomyces albofaciens]|uniref:HdeD family acid-resistance protein n=1 Tax=Streptomyces albofaciens TaxID=66866 RepID=UPI001FCC9F18|nr:HdeD family acid-resistance protein [Streptomyces albofaciens]
MFGVLALLWPQLTVLALALAFGAYALVGGAIPLGAAWRNRGKRWSALACAAASALSVVVAMVTALWPGLTALVLVVMAGAWAVVTGCLELWAALRMRQGLRHVWLWLVSAVVSVAAGVLLWLRPDVGAVAISLVLGACALVAGGVWLVSTWREHRVHTGRGGGPPPGPRGPLTSRPFVRLVTAHRGPPTAVRRGKVRKAGEHRDTAVRQGRRSGGALALAVRLPWRWALAARRATVGLPLASMGEICVEPHWWWAVRPRPGRGYRFRPGRWCVGELETPTAGTSSPCVRKGRCSWHRPSAPTPPTPASRFRHRTPKAMRPGCDRPPERHEDAAEVGEHGRCIRAYCLEAVP